MAGDVGSSSTDSSAGLPTFSGASTDTVGSADTTTITLNSPRTVLNFDAFDLSGQDTLNLVFAHSSHSALIRVAGGSANVNGAVNTFVGGAGSTVGGNVVVSAPGGISFGSSADVEVGNLVATTGATADAVFFNGNHTFTGAGNSITLGHGAVLDAAGLLGFIAPMVQQAATMGGNEALYGAAAAFSLTYDETTGLLGSFTPHVGAEAATVELSGSASGGSVAVSTLSSSSDSGGVYVDGTVAPTGAVAGGYGYTTVSAGGGLQRGAGQSSSDMQPVPIAGAPGQPIQVSGTIHGQGKVSTYSSGATTVTGQVRNFLGHDVVLDAAGDMVISGSGGVSSAGRAVVSTAADFVNGSGADAVAAGGTASAGGQWIVYAGDRDGNTYDGLDSGNTALWGDTLATRPPAQVTGNRYVFASRPTLTFTSLDHAKTVGEDATSSLSFDVTGYQPGEAGAFHADTATTAFSGAPGLSSEGAEAAAPVLPAGETYPITITRGSLLSDAGYGFAFNSTGRLTVVPQQGTGRLVGFSSPVDNNNMLNRAKAGQVIPLKWRFLDRNDQPITTLTSVSVSVSHLDCATGQSSDVIEQYASATGASELQNLGDGYYQYNWKSLKTYAGKCKTLTVDVGDGIPPLTALFSFVK